ncbi:MAG TPA: response regulator transcription factor [Candidatus Merdibacter merdigallinarum]|nr:response regulator transcription factor [Candidatus Merdibacter merdigallinarum]
MADVRHILVCDDEREVADLVSHLLEREGFSVRACYAGEEALQLLSAGSFDLAVLDIMMPGMDGFEVCRRLRAMADVRVAETPVIFLSAKGEEFDKVLGFTIGADDYVTKPFKSRELVVRVKARLRHRRGQQPTPNALSVRGIELDEASHSVRLHDEPLSLSPKEFDCLAELLRANGSPVSARDLYERVWRTDYNASSHNTVMVYIRHLRKKLAELDSSEEYIETVWGVGYRIVPNPPFSASDSDDDSGRF